MYEREYSDDDVLIMRIRSLRDELADERRKHRIEVDELRERLDASLEINAKLRRRTDDRDSRSAEIADKHIDILATLLSLYPYTPDKDLVFEFGIPDNRIRDVARILGLVKSAEERREAVEYMRRQQLDFIERRGGYRGYHPPINRVAVEKVNKRGEVVATYESINEACRLNHIATKTITKYCRKGGDTYKKGGFIFRLKNEL